MGTSANSILLGVRHAAAAAANTTGIAARAVVAELAWGCKIEGSERARPSQKMTAGRVSLLILIMKIIELLTGWALG